MAIQVSHTARNVFSETEHPVAERFRGRIDRGASAGLCAVGSERDTGSEKRGAPAPFRGSATRCTACKQRGGRWANEGVDDVPYGVDIGDLIREELEHVENHGNRENRGMGKRWSEGGRWMTPNR